MIYYIDPTGSDSAGRTGANTALQRFLTLTYAIGRATSGDIVHMNAGTYTINSRVDVPIGISIVGEGDTTLINTTYVATGDNDGVIRFNSSSSTNGNQSISYIKINAALTGTRAIAVNFRNNVEIHHCTIVNFLYSGVYFTGGAGSPWYNPVSPTHSTGNSIHDCNIIDCAHTADGSGNYGHIMLSAQDGILIYNNTLIQPALIVSGLERCGDILNGSWFKGVKIYNNILTKPNGVSGKWNFFSELFFTEGGCEIYGNTFNGNATLDIVDVRPGAYGFGVKIYNNLWYNSAQAPTTAESIQAINFEERGAVQGVYVYKNHFYNVNTGVQFDGLATTTNKTYINGNIVMSDLFVYYNIFENVGNTTNNYSVAISIKPEGSTPNLVWNNIFIDNNTIISGLTHKMLDGVMIETGGAMSNISIMNNIIKGAASSAISFSHNLPESIASSAFHVKNNLYYQNGTDGWTQSGVTVPGIDVAGNITGNPSFVSTTDFHLTAAKIGVAVALPAPLVDYSNVLIANPPTIGAYEFTTNVSTYQVSITILPANATNKSVTWSVVNRTGSATINQTGLLTVVTKGTVTAKATANDSSGVFGTLLLTF